MDACVYTGKFESDKVYLIIYVDDDLIMATLKKALNKIMNELKSNFIKISEGNVNFYVGIEIIRNRKAKTIFIHQSFYIERILKRFNMSDAKIKSTLADLGINLVSTGDLNKYDNLPYR